MRLARLKILRDEMRLRALSTSFFPQRFVWPFLGGANHPTHAPRNAGARAAGESASGPHDLAPRQQHQLSSSL
jgi:hypothetical protein